MESNIRVGPQSLQLGRRERTSEAIDDVPLVGDRRPSPLLREKESMLALTASTVLEGDDVSSGNGLLGLLHPDEGRRSRESGENAESEDDEVLGEHADGAG
jgi:hypothetical protein